MKPKRLRRMAASSSALILEVSVPAMLYVPLVGVSSSPRMFISVDLPEPDCPMMATKSPFSMDRLMFLSTCTRFSPVPK